MINLDLAAISAEIILALTGLIVLMADLFLGERRKTLLAVIAIVGILAAGYATHQQFQVFTGRVAYQPTADGAMTQQFRDESYALGYAGDGPVIVDNFSVVFRYIFLLGAALTILISVNYLKRESMPKGEYYALLIFCTLGMMVMSGAGDLLTLFLGLETLSIPIYVLAGYQRDRVRSNEAGLKYLIIGAFASSFLLYGIAFIYGATGSVRLRTIADFIGSIPAEGLTSNLFLLLGVILLFVGFAFKVAAVPFHMWTPDVYQGAPTAITAFMSVAVKAAAFAGLMRVFLVLVPFETLTAVLSDAIWWIAVLTMTLGNLVALAQKNIKRMLAYSSIAHAGYLLVGVLAAMKMGTLQMAMGGILYYLIAYTLMNIGAFAIVILVARQGDKYENIDDFAGLGARHPALAAVMSLFLLSLAGFPPTAGFFGKFYLFSAAVTADMVPLVVIAVLNSLISVFYYFGPMMAMYFKPSPEDEGQRGLIEVPLATEFTLYFTAMAVLLIGIIPNRIIPLVNSVIGF